MHATQLLFTPCHAPAHFPALPFLPPALRLPLHLRCRDHPRVSNASFSVQPEWQQQPAATARPLVKLPRAVSQTNAHALPGRRNIASIIIFRKRFF